MQETSRLRVYLSDYSSIISNRSKIPTVVEEFERREIPYIVNRAFGHGEETSLWFDLGNPGENRGETEGVLRKKFSRCSLTCMNLYDRKLFYCVPMCSAHFGGIFSGIRPRDFVDLCTPDISMDRLAAFQLGDIPGGYVSFCQNCDGMGKRVNQRMIPAGIQAV